MHCKFCNCARCKQQMSTKCLQLLARREDAGVAWTILASDSKVCAFYLLLISWRRRRLRSNSTVLCPTIHSPSFHPSSRDSIIESIAPSALPIRSNRQTYGPRTELQYTTTKLELNLTIRLSELAQPGIQKSARHCVKSVGGMWATKWIVTFYRYVSAAVIASPFRKDRRRRNQGRVKRWRKEMEE